MYAKEAADEDKAIDPDIEESVQEEHQAAIPRIALEIAIHHLREQRMHTKMVQQDKEYADYAEQFRIRLALPMRSGNGLRISRRNGLIIHQRSEFAANLQLFREIRKKRMKKRRKLW